MKGGIYDKMDVVFGNGCFIKLLLSGKTQNGKKSRPGALSTWTSGYISQK